MSVRRCGQTVDDFVDRAVSATGNEELAAFGSGATGNFGRIAWSARLQEIGVNACGGENAPCTVQVTKTPTAAIAGSRVVNQERVGKSCEHALREGFQTVRHARAMLSLDNAYSYEELRDFDRRVHEAGGRAKVEYVAEHKFDGLSISLQYKDALLARGVTRGDGTTGEDVTPNVKTIRSIPLRVEAAALKKVGMPADFEVRGEVVMPRKSFEALNREQERLGKKIFANPRSAAAGAVRVLDPTIT